MGSKTPLGLPSFVLLICYWVVISISSKLIGSSDSFQQLLHRNGAFEYFEDVKDREIQIKTVVGVGMSSCLLSGAAVGILLRFIGPKFSAVLGLLSISIGLLFLFFQSNVALYFVGAVLMGAAYQLITNAHYGVSVLFPRNTALVLALLGAGGDVSLGVPLLFFYIVSNVDIAITRLLILYMIFGIGVSTVVSIVLVPTSSYKSYLPQLKEEIEDKEKQNLIPSTNEDPLLWSCNIKDQFLSIQFLAFFPFFILNYLRYKHFMIHCRSMFTEMHSDAEIGGFYGNIMSASLPLGFIVAIMWGFIVDIVGPVPVMFYSNACGVAFSFLAYLGIPKTELLIIGFFCLNGAYIIGIGFAYCGKTFGYRTFSTIQGTIATITGIAAIGFDLWWNDFVVSYLQSQRNAMLIVGIIGIFMFVFPLSLLLCRAPTAPYGAVTRQSSIRLSLCGGDFQCYDEQTLQELDKSLRSSLK